MINFERYVARRNIDLQELFKEKKITSDSQLREYCTKNGLTQPVELYFEEAPKAKETVQKPAAKKPAKRAARKPAEGGKKEETKKPRTTRTRRTRTKKTS